MAGSLTLRLGSSLSTSTVATRQANNTTPITGGHPTAGTMAEAGEGEGRGLRL